MSIKVTLQTDAIKGNEMSTAQQQAIQSDLLNRIRLQEQKKKAREEYIRTHNIQSSISDEDIDKAIFISQQRPPELRQSNKTKEQIKSGNKEIKRREELQQLEKNMNTADNLMSISTDYIPLVGSLLRAGQYNVARDNFGRDYARNRYRNSPLLSTTLDLATIPFGVGTKQLASSYIGGMGGRYVGDKYFDSPNAGQFIGTLLGGTIPSQVNKGKRLYDLYKGFKIDDVSVANDRSARDLASINPKTNPKQRFVIGDIYTANKPVEFLNQVSEEDIIKWIRQNMDKSLENALERGENGAFERLANLYDENLQRLNPSQKKAAEMYQDALFGKVHPNNLPRAMQLILLGDKSGTIPEAPKFALNIKPRPRAFGLNYSLGPLDKSNEKVIFNPDMDDNAGMHLFTKEYNQGSDKQVDNIFWTKAHEQMHGLVSPYEPFTYPSKGIINPYFDIYNNTELLARYQQLLNAGGAKEGQPIMSPELFNWWRDNYVRLTSLAYPETTTKRIKGYTLDENLQFIPIESEVTFPVVNTDNNMFDFFDYIPSKETSNFINWASPQALKNGGLIKSNRSRNKKLRKKNR